MLILTLFLQLIVQLFYLADGANNLAPIYALWYVTSGTWVLEHGSRNMLFYLLIRRPV
jgi:hypothetical protein